MSTERVLIDKQIAYYRARGRVRRDVAQSGWGMWRGAPRFEEA